MAFRNGIVADAFHKAGAPYRVVFGLQIPQLGEIARRVMDGVSAEERHNLAFKLWEDRGVRESRLLATWFFDASRLSIEQWEAIAADCLTQEEADILCWRQLRRYAGREALTERLRQDEREGSKRCLEALKRE